jgi:undecaprenyl diphosphate synthase
MRLIEPNEAGQLPHGPLPSHIALIMDGNGRWAEYRDLERTKGHLAAKRAMFECIELALDLEIRWLSFYAFSLENWSRPAGEIETLMNYAREVFNRKIVRSLGDRGVRFHFIGDLRDERIPRQTSSWFVRIQEETVHNKALDLVIAINYSGQVEVLEAAKGAMRRNLAPEDLTLHTMQEFMSIPQMPPVDLLVRTSGEQRLSNFLLWHLGYAELVFMDTLWPDFNRGHLQSAIREFQTRYRRFGMLPWVDVDGDA